MGTSSSQYCPSVVRRDGVVLCKYSLRSTYVLCPADAGGQQHSAVNLTWFTAYARGRFSAPSLMGTRFFLASSGVSASLMTKTPPEGSILHRPRSVAPIERAGTVPVRRQS